MTLLIKANPPFLIRAWATIHNQVLNPFLKPYELWSLDLLYSFRFSAKWQEITHSFNRLRIVPYRQSFLTCHDTWDIIWKLRSTSYYLHATFMLWAVCFMMKATKMDRFIWRVCKKPVFFIILSKTIFINWQNQAEERPVRHFCQPTIGSNTGQKCKQVVIFINWNVTVNMQQCIHSELKHKKCNPLKVTKF